MVHSTLTFYMERFTVIFDVQLGYLSYLFMISQVSQQVSRQGSLGTLVTLP